MEGKPTIAGWRCDARSVLKNDRREASLEHDMASNARALDFIRIKHHEVLSQEYSDSLSTKIKMPMFPSLEQALQSVTIYL